MAASHCDDLYQVAGHRALGLTAGALPHFRVNSSVDRLTSTVAQLERNVGNSAFELRQAFLVPRAMLFEVAHTYLGLRRMFPQVTAGHIDLCEAADTGSNPNLLAYSMQYPVTLPLTRAGEIRGRSAAAERRFILRESINDPWTSGCIRLGGVFSDPELYSALVAFWDERNEKALRRGRPDRVRHVPLETTALSYIVSHEFGHLVEGELLEEGVDRLLPIMAALSEVVFGSRPVSPAAYRRHLINYPASHRGFAGPAEGGAERRAATRRALKPLLGAAFGAYAAHNRDELFAEVVAVAICGTAPARDRLEPFLAALRADGIMR